MNYTDTCVVLAAGRGTRMKSELPKVLLPVCGAPILQHIVDYWKREIKRWIFVVGFQAEKVEACIADDLDVRVESIAFQKEQKGIAHAIYQVKDVVPERFMVVLGDCLNIGGTYSIPDDMVQGYGVWMSKYAKYQGLGCCVTIRRGQLRRIVEKGDVVVPGVGTYFFDRRVFNYIKNTNASHLRGEVEISDVIMKMVQAGEKVSAVEYDGEFINCTTQADVAKAERLMGSPRWIDLKLREETDIEIKCADATKKGV